MNRPSNSATTRPQESGFTRTDLVVVIVLLAALALALLPALASDRVSSQSFQCLNNLRQLTTAWLMYSGDNSDKICRTGGQFSSVSDPSQANAQPGQPLANWVLGTTATDPNPDFIRNGLLYAYVRDLDVYKCPADQSLNSTNGPRLRSISMNAWMNPINTEGLLDTATFIAFGKQNDIRKPSQTWVLIDENPGNINDGWFMVAPRNPPEAALMWKDLPATYHNHAGGLSFADGRAELRRWTDRSVLGTKPPNARKDLTYPDDLPWLVERTTYPR